MVQGVQGGRWAALHSRCVAGINASGAMWLCVAVQHGHAEVVAGRWQRGPGVPPTGTKSFPPLRAEVGNDIFYAYFGRSCSKNNPKKAKNRHFWPVLGTPPYPGGGDIGWRASGATRLIRPTVTGMYTPTTRRHRDAEPFTPFVVCVPGNGLEGNGLEATRHLD